MADLKTKLASQLNKSETLPDTQENGGLVVLPETSGHSLAPLPVSDFAMTFSEAENRLRMLQTFVKELMIPGIDYGIIPGCPKPSLLKPGAEKLCDIYGFSKLVTITNRHEDWEKGFFSYEVKTTLISKRTGIAEAEGVGNCNSRERKYRNQDAFSISNTILKMAKKRAIVDAVLSATRSSGIFSQDIEELNTDPDPVPLRPSPTPRVVPVQAVSPVNKKQLNTIFSLIAHKNIPVEQAKAWMVERYQVVESKKLTTAQADDFLDYLRRLRPTAMNA